MLTLGDFENFASGHFGIWTKLPGTEGRISIALSIPESVEPKILSLHGRLNFERPSEMSFNALSFVRLKDGEEQRIDQKERGINDPRCLVSWFVTYNVCCVNRQA